ncbi:MAG: hypothetical protein LBU20_02900, partial [Candidatus Nomurabacteria bacterium]|nr:hypothetical protein [Candidatus Nomurabacteria bacterium]
MVKLYKVFGYVAGWLVWLVVSYFLAQVLIFTPFELLAVEIRSDDTAVLTAVSALVYALTLAILVFGPYLARKSLKLPAKISELVGLARKVEWADLKKAVGTFLLYLAVLIGVMSVFAFLFPELSEQEQNLGFDKVGNNWLQLGLIFVS